MNSLADVPGSRLPGAIQGLLVFRDPYGALGYSGSRYGDRFRFALGGRRGGLVSSPEDIGEVFLHDPEVLRAGAAYRPLNSRAIDRFILTLDGDDYARTRKAVIPPFKTEAMADYVGPIRQVVHCQLDRAQP